MQTVEQRIKELSEAIILHRHHYYNEDPLVSDEEFDALCDELEDLDPEAPALTVVGSEVSSEWPKVKHAIIAGSLTKVKNSDALAKWISTSFGRTDSIFWSEKIDGLTILLEYKDGVLSRASTRGSGVEGSDITPNVKKMRGIKAKLSEPFTGVIRGEVLMRNSIFEKHYANEGYANARNSASGISMRHDGTGSEHLEVFCYEVISGEKLDSEVFQFQYLERLGFKTPGHGASATEKRVEWITEIWNEYQSGKRAALDYDIDGLVIRVNDLTTQAKLGIKHNRPVGATAFKFISAGANSVVKDIVWQTGSSGRITPVLEIEPVKIAGAMISRVSLYNDGHIKHFGIDIGATVRIIRSGDVIPVCEGVVKSTGTVAKRPQECASCGGRVGMAGEFLVCQNSFCAAQVEGRISVWIKKMEIKEFGDKLIARLVENKLCLTIPDLYKLTIESLSEVDRMGKKSAVRCLNNLNDQLKDMTLDKFLGSLSIPIIGRTTIRLLMSAGYNTLDKILCVSENELTTIKGFGPEKAQALLKGLKDNAKIIDELLMLGVKPMKNEKKELNTNGKLAGKHFCITGKTEVKRETLSEMISAKGGVFDRTVSKETNYLVVADPASTTVKMQKAKASGIEIIGEQDLMVMIGVV